MALTQESVLSFLLEHGGKVKNSELLHSFRNHINCTDPAEKLQNRDVFKKLVNSVAVVKQMDGVKFVVVKKRYQDFVRERTQMDDSLSGHSSSFSCAYPQRDEESRLVYSDIENNNNVCCPLDVSWSKCPENITHTSVECVRKVDAKSRDLNGTVKVLNVSGDHVSRSGKSGAVFAVVAVKSPPPVHDGLHPHVHRQNQNSHKTSAPPVVQPVNSPRRQRDAHERPCSKDAIQPVVGSQVKPQSKCTKPGDDVRYVESVPLEPLAHEWLVKCAAGLWGQIPALLQQDPGLAQRKDFMSGFTALHWAAKDGNCSVIRKLVDTSRRRGVYVDINGKSHGGYTPLHIAAMHGQAEVMALLVQRYGASVNERDHAGKKALHYLGEGASAETTALLGGLPRSKSRERTEGEDDRDHSKGFTGISKLFQPHMGKKHRTTTKNYAHDW